jgi:hypothetical protein
METMKTKVAANLFRGMESVGGHLYFGEDAMVFKSHALNIQTGDTHICYADIENVKKRNTLGLVPNGILVTMKDKTQYKFVVWKRNDIIAFIDSRRQLVR